MATLDLGQVVAPDCMSAYEAAVAGGYTGSEETFQLQLGSLLTTGDVVDNLTTTSTTGALSANQGKVLSEALGNKANKNGVVQQLLTLEAVSNAEAGEYTWVQVSRLDWQPEDILDGALRMYLTKFKISDGQSTNYFLRCLDGTMCLAMYLGEPIEDGIRWAQLTTNASPTEYDLALATGLSPYLGETCAVFVNQNHTAMIQFIAQIASDFTRANGAIIGQLPVGLRPKYTTSLMGHAEGGAQVSPCDIQLNTDGTICLWHAPTDAVVIATSGVYLLP